MLPLSAVLYTGGPRRALLKGAAAGRFARVAKRTPIVGAFMLSAALGVMSILEATGAMMTYRPGWTMAYANALLALTIVMSIVIALGMHLLVFEDMTDEIRRTNLALAGANEEVQAVWRSPIRSPAATTAASSTRSAAANWSASGATASPSAFCSSISIDSKSSTTDSATTQETTVLRTLGGMLQRQVRQSDYVIRWGGDEFLLLLTCTVTGGRR